MTVSMPWPTVYPVYRPASKPVVNHVKVHRPWISCPRCIGGSMYPENSREYACIQCGYHLYQKSASRKPGEETPVMNNKTIGLVPHVAICVNRED